MTVESFMEKLQSYYGPYPDGQKIGDYVTAYLKSEIYEDGLTRLFKFVTYDHPHRFGPPGIAEMEKAITAGIKNRKGADVHKIKMPEYKKVEITEDEYKRGGEIVDTGLKNMIFEKLNQSKQGAEKVK